MGKLGARMHGFIVNHRSLVFGNMVSDLSVAAEFPFSLPCSESPPWVILVMARQKLIIALFQLCLKTYSR